MILYQSAEGNDLAREILKRLYGRVVELVDSLDSGSSVHCGRAGSSPASPTKREQASSEACSFFFCAPGVGKNLMGESPEPAWYRNSDDLEYNLAKQKVSGDIEHTGNTDDIFVTQLVRLAADETAQRTLRHTDTSSKLRLCDFSEFFSISILPHLFRNITDISLGFAVIL